MLNLKERFVVDAAGHLVEVVLPIESYRRLLAWMAETAPSVPGEAPLAEWRTGSATPWRAPAIRQVSRLLT